MTKKDVGLRIRLDRGLRDGFVAACQVRDRPAAQVIREFMRDYVRESGSPSATGTPQREGEEKPEVTSDSPSSSATNDDSTEGKDLT